EPQAGINVDASAIEAADDIQLLFSETAGILIQAANENVDKVTSAISSATVIGTVTAKREASIVTKNNTYVLDIDSLRDTWYKTSYLLDAKQTAKGKAKERFDNYKNQSLEYIFPKDFKGAYAELGLDPDRKTPSGVKAAIIREKGVNGDREMAYAMHLAGFDVKDVHMTDLISGREDLSDVNFIAFVGGFSN